MSKIVMGIHGLGNKPPKELLEKWWKEAILEGLRKHNHSIKDFNFELVYWADILHKTPLNPDETNKEDPLYLGERYIPEGNEINLEKRGFREKALEYLEKYSEKILVNGVLSLNIPSITELFIHRHLRDLEEYYSDSFTSTGSERRFVREIIIERLVEKLRKHKRKRIFLVAHSMGSIIAYDALNYHAPELKVETFATIGSPLGQNYVLNKMKSKIQILNKDYLSIPENITGGWFNFADEEDQVAINHNLAKIFRENSRRIGIKDVLVYNTYKSSDNRNPHKSYGYLRTPEFSTILGSFLVTRRSDLFTRIKEIFRR